VIVLGVPILFHEVAVNCGRVCKVYFCVSELEGKGEGKGETCQYSAKWKTKIIQTQRKPQTQRSKPCDITTPSSINTNTNKTRCTFGAGVACLSGRRGGASPGIKGPASTRTPRGVNIAHAHRLAQVGVVAVAVADARLREGEITSSSASTTSTATHTATAADRHGLASDDGRGAGRVDVGVAGRLHASRGARGTGPTGTTTGC